MKILTGHISVWPQMRSLHSAINCSFSYSYVCKILLAVQLLVVMNVRFSLLAARISVENKSLDTQCSNSSFWFPSTTNIQRHLYSNSKYNGWAMDEKYRHRSEAASIYFPQPKDINHRLYCKQGVYSVTRQQMITHNISPQALCMTPCLQMG